MNLPIPTFDTIYMEAVFNKIANHLLAIIEATATELNRRIDTILLSENIDFSFGRNPLIIQNKLIVY